MDTSVSPILCRRENRRYYSHRGKKVSASPHIRTQQSFHLFVDNPWQVVSDCGGLNSRLKSTVTLDMRAVTRAGSNSKLVGQSSDPSLRSFQVCGVFGLNCKVCSANSNSISLGAREPWGLKGTLVSLCCYSIAPCLLAAPHTPLLRCAVVHKHFCEISVQRKLFGAALALICATSR